MRTNRGKKYTKLRGDEVPTPDNEKRAREFMDWYAANMDKLKRYADYPIDGDLLTDTALKIYDTIALKGAQIKDNTAYFLQSYRSVYINYEKKKAGGEILTAPSSLERQQDKEGEVEFNSAEYEEAVEQIRCEVLDYVRSNYDEMSISLFEMYVGLTPDISYRKLSAMLGLPHYWVWSSVGSVKKGVVKKFELRKDILLSVVNF